MNNTIFGKMIQDYSDLEDFSIITYTESGKNYDAIYKDLLLARQAGVDFSADIQTSYNKNSNHSYVKQTLIFIKTNEVKLLREHLQGNMRIDYCTSAAYTLSPACIFKLAVGYGVNKVHCERDELAVGKILMKAGKSNAYVFVSPEIHEIAESDGATKPILTMPAYGTLYKRSSKPTKTHLSASGIVVRGGNGICLRKLDTAKAAVQQSNTMGTTQVPLHGYTHTRSRAFVHAECLDRKGFMKTKDFALKKIFDAMAEVGCSLRFEMWDFQSDPRFNFDRKHGSEIQLEYETLRMREFLTQEKVCIEGPEAEKELVLNGLGTALKKYFQLPLDAVYAETGKLKLLIINDKEHDPEKIYEQTKHLLTQHITIQQLRECDRVHALIRTCLRCLCVRNDLYTSRLTLIRELPKSFRNFIYGDVNGDIYQLTISEDRAIKIRRCSADSYVDAREYLRSVQADAFMAMKDSSGQLYTIRDTCQPAIPPVRQEINDYNNRRQETKDKIGALFNFSWTIEHGDFFYISGNSVRENRSPRNFPHVYEIHPIDHAKYPDSDEIFALINVGFVRSDQESAVVPWGIKYLREYATCLV